MDATATPVLPDLSLVERLLETATDLGPEDREALLSLVAIAVSAVRPDEPIPPSLMAGMQMIRRIRGNLHPGDSGVLFHGRPSWVTDEVLAALRAEATAIRCQAARSPHYWFSRGGPVVQQLSRTPEVRRFVESLAGPVNPSIKANYSYYEYPGDGVKVHVDRDGFALIILMLLRHDHRGAPASRLHVYPPELGPIHLALRPGDLVLLHAGSTFHQRTPVGPDEVVQTLSIGHMLRDFTPKIPWPDR